MLCRCDSLGAIAFLISVISADAVINRSIPQIGALLGISLYVSSFFFPVFSCIDGPRHMGYNVAWAGWMAIFALDPRWFANPLALLIFIAVARGKELPRVSLYSILVLAAAISCLYVPAMACGSGAGGAEPSQGLRLGGYLWIAALSVLSLTGFAWKIAQRANDG